MNTAVTELASYEHKLIDELCLVLSLTQGKLGLIWFVVCFDGW